MAVRLSDLARDAFEIVHVQIETKRAYRSSQINKERREKAALSGAAPPKPTYGKKGAASQADIAQVDHGRILGVLRVRGTLFQQVVAHPVCCVP
jgi:hypothetical protein